MPRANQPERAVVEGIEPAYLGLGRVFALARDAVIVGEAASGRIVLWNAAAEAIFGYTGEEARSILIEELVPEELKASHRAGLAAYAGTGRGSLLDSGTTVELPALRKDGSRLSIELTLTPLETDRLSGRFVMAIVRDITERKRTEAELAHTLEALRSANKQLSDFAAVTAHDLGQPLSVLSGFSSLLTEHWDDSTEDQRKRYADVIRRQVDRMAKLTHDLLTVSRLDAGVLEPQTLTVTVATAVAQAADELDGVAIDRVDCPEDLRVTADPDHVHRILTNYLSNAFKYGRPPVRVVAEPAGEMVEISVSDEGEGVADDVVPRLFSRFARGPQVAGSIPGSGLGLSIVRGLARLNRGDAWYEPNRPKGSRFRLRLPRPSADTG